MLIDYEYRATSTIFVHDKCGLLVCLKESAWHRHRLSADLENKSDLARQRYYSLPSVAFQKQSVIWKYLVCLASVQAAFAKAMAGMSFCFNPVIYRWICLIPSI